MCLYADSSFQKYNYLFAYFWTDFFPFIEKHIVILHKFSKIGKREVNQIKEIVEKLSAELDADVVCKSLVKSEKNLGFPIPIK